MERLKTHDDSYDSAPLLALGDKVHWFKKAVKPTEHWVASERLNFITGRTYIDVGSYGYYSKKEAQDTADRWTSEFQNYYWVVDDTERAAIIAKQKTEVLERTLGVK